MRKYSVVNEEGVVEEFVQLVGEQDHAALNDAIELARRAGEDVVEHLADGGRVVVWELAGEEPWEGEDVIEHHADGSREVVWSIDDATDEPWEGEDRFADGDALASAGFGTDEDYGCFDAGDEW